MRLALLIFLLALPCLASGAAPATLRVDLQHGGDATREHYALERVVIEPLPWPGNPDRPIDDSNRGMNLFEVVDPDSGAVLYSRGYSTIFGEWQSTDEAKATARSFQESLRFPRPDGPVELRVHARDETNGWKQVWSLRVDPDAPDVERVLAPAPARPIAIHHSGDSAHKVDLLILGDGYAADELDAFEADARRMVAHLFTVSPFRERRDDFNVWALTVPVPESGVSRPSTGLHRASATGLRYDIFGSERYALSVDNRAWRELAQYAPYEFVEIIFNSETYGGGGIFGMFSTAAADSDWADYLFVHEFGHHFAGLADEYYTSPVAYDHAAPGERPEPWEPNATANTDPATLKWRELLTPGTALPTDWPKAEFEAFQRENQAERARIRAERRPEAEMSELFRREQAFIDALFDPHANRSVVGAFEGANYQATGYFRPQLQCLMFTRHDAFCDVCRDGVEEIIDLYSGGRR
ncbi:IgA Peptidase M64 [Arenimonas composti]|uniref:Peptidase M64 N-terminal domain-containing protein n=1 Tax=Arenimonas composti TR7-09 = DSM 18010 TaxID=1121013 RepID=A0A091BB46_9GAMM|nr:IgA Peptidase M64 [Arenimonas composti]KFN48737.1 hypothetical protein P873_13855 [Arenimonas composti TR7-09 = DSM 18010]